MRAEARRSWHPAFARWGGEKSEADAAKAASVTSSHHESRNGAVQTHATQSASQDMAWLNVLGGFRHG